MGIDRYALNVGINRYSQSQYNLSGCVNDATDWGDLLESRGYRVTTLLDSDATSSNIQEALREHVSRLGYQDRLVFTFSGHGSWRPDYNGDEADGRDEALVAYGMDLITDDALYPILTNRTYGSRVITLSDSCHSGTVSRLVALEAEAFDNTPRFINPHLLDVTDPETEERLEKTRARRVARNSGVLISGSADHEYSYDAWFGDRPNGAFTRTAIDAFNAQTLGDVTYKEWHEDILKSLPSDDYPQTPQFSATSYQARNWVALD